MISKVFFRREALSIRELKNAQAVSDPSIISAFLCRILACFSCKDEASNEVIAVRHETNFNIHIDVSSCTSFSLVQIT